MNTYFIIVLIKCKLPHHWRSLYLASRIVEVDGSGREPIRLHHSAGSSGVSRRTPISVSSSKLKNSFMEQANIVKANHNISKSVHRRASGVMSVIPIHPIIVADKQKLPHLWAGFRYPNG